MNIEQKKSGSKRIHLNQLYNIQTIGKTNLQGYKSKVTLVGKKRMVMAGKVWSKGLCEINTIFFWFYFLIYILVMHVKIYQVIYL